jgi:hypothetical protein
MKVPQRNGCGNIIAAACKQDGEGCRCSSVNPQYTIHFEQAMNVCNNTAASKACKQGEGGI